MRFLLFIVVCFGLGCEQALLGLTLSVTGPSHLTLACRRSGFLMLSMSAACVQAGMKHTATKRIGDDAGMKVVK